MLSVVEAGTPIATEVALGRAVGSVEMRSVNQSTIPSVLASGLAVSDGAWADMDGPISADADVFNPHSKGNVERAEPCYPDDLKLGPNGIPDIGWESSWVFTVGAPPAGYKSLLVKQLLFRVDLFFCPKDDLKLIRRGYFREVFRLEGKNTQPDPHYSFDTYSRECAAHAYCRLATAEVGVLSLVDSSALAHWRYKQTEHSQSESRDGGQSYSETEHSRSYYANLDQNEIPGYWGMYFAQYEPEHCGVTPGDHQVPTTGGDDAPPRPPERDRSRDVPTPR
jgi:hypothetical protein